MKSFLSLFVFILASQVSALPMPNPQTLQRYQSQILFQPQLKAYDFEGIAKLSNCSGALIKYENSLAKDKGLILTNGHCLGGSGFLNPGEVVVNKKQKRSFELYDSSGSIAGRVYSSKLLYATMTKTDLAIYELSESFEQIEKKYQVRALTLSSISPAEKTPIEILSGYWNRGYVCEIEKEVFNLLEDGYLWVRSLRYSEPDCDTIPGTSGSPVLEAGTRNVIAINNTGNEDNRMCDINNPCEIDEQGNRTVVNGSSYGQQTFWVYSCLNAQRQFDLTTPGCELPQ